MTEFVGILDGEGSIWGVRFPDLPGCVGGGSSPDEAIADATTALRDVIAYKVGNDLPVPVPSSEEVILSRGLQSGDTVVLVSPAA